jgi:flagellar biosynthetic protein FliR
MQIPLEVLEALLKNELALSVWPFFRIAGVVMVAPVFGARLVPTRVRLALSVAATVVLAPLVPAAPPF